MTDKFINPITLSFELLASHKGLLRDTLSEQGLRPDDLDEILESMEVDRGLFLSINPRHAVGKASFRQFCTDHGLAYELPDALGWLPNARLYVHQEEAIRHILAGETTVLATGTGSGKTEAFLIPILDHCLKHPGPGVKALIIYPMNALANDQVRRIQEIVGILTSEQPITFGLFVGSVEEAKRNAIRQNPPDILITNYVMLDWMLTRSKDQPIFADSSDSLRYIVLDEIHTYRGNKATHLKYLLTRLKTRLTGPVVQIGTSATLQTDPSRGYLHSDDDRLSSFIKPLLDVEAYSFVTAKFEAESGAPPDGAPLPAPSDADGLGWALEADTTTGLENLGRLTGQTYASWDLKRQKTHGEPPQSKVFRDMQQNRFVVDLKRSLSEHGAQSFVEIVQLLTSLLPPSHPLHDVEQVAKAYLSAIAFVNNLQSQYRDGQPLLDFRVHLFLRNIGGYLKRCIKCHRYHSGKQEFCQDCGFPLFCVYRYDAQQCVGKVSGNRLKWELYPESTDRKNTYYVLISSAEEAQGDGAGDGDNRALGFRGVPQLDRDEIVLDYDAYGQFRLSPLPLLRRDRISEQVIPLVDGTQDHQYLHNLVRAVLDFQPHERKKLLGFIDNREKASRYASILQDEFASQFFEAYLKLCRRCYLPGDKADLVTVLTILHRHVPDREDLLPVEQELFDELDLWYRRYVCKPPRLFRSKKKLLQLKDPDRFTDFERELLGAFITERAIAKSHQGDRPEGRYIRFMTHLATDHKGMYYEASQSSEDRAYPSISLGEQAREYGDLVGLHSPEEIAGTVEALVQRGILCAGETSDGKTHYYIDPHQVLLAVPPSDDDEYRKYDEYDDLREQLLLTTAVHSSEVRPDKRAEIEAAFHENALNVVMATPTLEMGIDIGQLDNVLMIGVPPLPSNYAQRAGRAGRGRKNSFALIVTFCSEHDEHDSYYFHRPRQMINGVVSPPAFNPHNHDIISKHVNAFMLAGQLDSRQTLANFLAHADDEISQRASKVKNIFGADAEMHLRGAFKPALTRALSGLNSGSAQQHFYNTGFFPDYSFRRDQIYVVDAKDTALFDSGKLQESRLADRALSEREPELAYYKFSPGETVFMAGDVYQITPAGRSEPLEVDDETLARSYQYFEASRQVRHATKRKVYRRYSRDESFVNDDGAFVGKRKVLEVAFFPECRLFFVNRGCLDFDDAAAAFSDADGQRFNVGYEVDRQAIVLRFDANVCADEKVYLSLISTLDRTIKDEYGLDESEIRLLVDVRPQPADIPGVEWIYVVLYETDGNGNVPLKEVFHNFDGVVQAAHRQMQDCAGTPDQPCDTGCYLCTRSYATRRFAGSVDKQIALMFTGYLLGQAKFRPAIAEPPPTVSQFDLTLRLERHGDAFSVRAPGATYSAPLDDDQNTVIFDLLSRAIRSEFSEGMRALRIIAREDHVVKAINGDHGIKTNADAFARFQFELLRFRQVRAEKG